MQTETGSEVEARAAHRKGHFTQRFEGATDMLIVGIIIALGAAMLVGLITASGAAPWMK
ncbi:MAG TPA: hypothetical protein PLV04_07190 [Phenylobacterium sp.]|jgi:hypothetical protein|uniref:Uncharacterized protein n=1 Tax=Phenylobacterium conjunctum TaxID=1298959 RepID=A0ABW3SZD5_9CAUL|nr:hypothetical protein [Phenylobacterium sp.]HQN50568.1 hypothetical protein [Phenylobacterium sp.]HQP20757.1 hypothetical protein [Phenylobacterium sp.]